MATAAAIDPAAPVFGGDRQVMLSDGKSALPATVGDFLQVEVNGFFHFAESTEVAVTGVAEVRECLADEIRLTTTRTVSLPILFGLGRNANGGFSTTNMVNLLVVGDHCYLQRANGPQADRALLQAAAANGNFATAAVAHPVYKLPNPVRGQLIAAIGLLPAPGPRVDLFELCARMLLEAEGNTVHFVDTWNLYHGEGGGLHCATNCRRQPDAPLPWWTYPN